MDRTAEKIVVRLAILIALLLVAAAFFSFQHKTPLTPIETAFVGHWSHISLPDEQPLTELSFASDRAFRTKDGEFAGRWWISNGKLKVRYWRDEPTIVPFANVWRDLRARTESWGDLVFDEKGDRAEFSQPESPAESALVRVR